MYQANYWTRRITYQYANHAGIVLKKGTTVLYIVHSICNITHCISMTWVTWIFRHILHGWTHSSSIICFEQLICWLDRVQCNQQPFTTITTNKPCYIFGCFPFLNMCVQAYWTVYDDDQSILMNVMHAQYTDKCLQPNVH